MKTILLSSVFVLCSCGIKAIPEQQKKVATAWNGLQTQYTNRTNIAPKMALIARKYVKNEKAALGNVMMARAYAVQFKLETKDLTPANIKQLQIAQDQFSKALNYLIGLSDKYPGLKSDSNFKDFRVQLQSADKLISENRSKYAEEAEHFNSLITGFPANLTNKLYFHYTELGVF